MTYAEKVLKMREEQTQLKWHGLRYRAISSFYLLVSDTVSVRQPDRNSHLEVGN